VNEGNLRKTVTTYSDDDLLVTTVSDLHTFDDGLLQTITRHDERGRPVRTRVSDGTPLGTAPTATDGINVTIRYTVVPGVGLQTVTSSPHRTTQDPTLDGGKGNVWHVLDDLLQLKS